MGTARAACRTLHPCCEVVTGASLLHSVFFGDPLVIFLSNMQYLQHTEGHIIELTFTVPTFRINRC